jgi:hypothetical protein
MGRLLDPAQFQLWLTNFLPPLESDSFAPISVIEPLQPSDNERARFASVSLQRGRALKTIADHLPPSDPRANVLRRLSALHGALGLNLMRREVHGTDWLPAFALLYLEN